VLVAPFLVLRFFGKACGFLSASIAKAACVIRASALCGLALKAFDAELAALDKSPLK
jgi:hypothetical protein